MIRNLMLRKEISAGGGRRVILILRMIFTRFMATEQALLNVKTDEEFDMTYGVEVRVLTNRF